MVSFKAILLPLAGIIALSQGYSHGHQKRYQNNARNYGYVNGTSSVDVYSVPGTGIESTQLPIKTYEPAAPTVEGAPTETSAPTTTCITVVETQAYTYTLGNGKAHTTTITHTQVITKTIIPVPQGYPTNTPGPHNPYPHAEEEEDFTSTTTSTSTVKVYYTETIPRPQETGPYIDVANVETAPPCAAASTVYVTVPLEIVTQVIKETIKEIVTVTQTVPEVVYTPPTAVTQTSSELVYSPPPVVPTPPPVVPLYTNQTTTNQTTTDYVKKVTLTVVPVPYHY